MRRTVGRALRGLRSGLAALGCFIATGGCYSYQPVPPAAVAPGAAVRAELTSEGVLRLEPLLGTLQREVIGEVIEADGRQLLMLARTGSRFDGVTPVLERQRIVIDQQEILRLEQRRLQRTRSAVFSAALASALVGTAIYFFTARSRGGETRQPDGGPEL
jgi:hypothetical protein